MFSSLTPVTDADSLGADYTVYYDDVSHTRAHLSTNFSLFAFFFCRVLGSFKNTNDRETVYAWFTFSHWLIYANSAANPIIYNFLSGEFWSVLIYLPGLRKFI